MEAVINKVVITEEAAFDYESAYALPIPKADIKSECEAYIEERIKSGRLLGRYYFRAKYLDEATDKMLLLFFYKGQKFGRMQMWELKGICEADDWSERMEEEGQVRLWLKTSINPKEDGDWVEDLRIREEKQRKEAEDYYDEE